MTDNTQPEALRLAEILEGDYCPDWFYEQGVDEVAAELRRQHTRIAELEAQIEALSGVQALRAAPAGWELVPEDATEEMVRATDKVNFANADADGTMHNVWNVMLAASPTPPAEQQAAPKAAPRVGNSGFDHKTAADLLNNKTVSDEAVRKFVAASRWAHDERAALSATLLAMHGVLTSREAEIALLKKALLD